MCLNPGAAHMYLCVRSSALTCVCCVVFARIVSGFARHIIRIRMLCFVSSSVAGARAWGRLLSSCQSLSASLLAPDKSRRPV